MSEPLQETTKARRARMPAQRREELILDVAAKLFYAHGIRAVGMDELITSAGLAKMSVYRIFPTKDDVIAGYLTRLQEQILDAIDVDMARHPDDAAAAIQAILDAVERDLAGPGFRGCPFANAAADFDSPDHPARAIARSYREQLRDRLRVLSGRLGAGREVGDQLAVLIDGAYLNAAHLGPDGPAGAGLSLARRLVKDNDRRERSPVGATS